jgi:hypothetical protein
MNNEFKLSLEKIHESIWRMTTAIGQCRRCKIEWLPNEKNSINQFIKVQSKVLIFVLQKIRPYYAWNAVAYIVIPCYNEKGCTLKEYSTLLKLLLKRLFFINDGSTDKTLQVLTRFQEKYSDQVHIISLLKNWGKRKPLSR